MKKNILSLAILGSLSVGAYAQEIPYFPTSNIEVTAVVDAGCDLTAENINFGILAMPLSDSTAQADMNIKCSKGTNLSIAIKLNTNENYRFEQYRNGYGPEYNIYNSSNEFVGRIACGQGKYEQHVAYSSQTVADIYNDIMVGYDFGLTETVWKPDTLGVCKNYVPRSGDDLSGNFGVMSGSFSSEKLKFFITLPNSTEKWSLISKHSLMATGDNQVIPMKANIKRADNEAHRYTPDTYQSTLTVVLDY